MKCVVIDIGNTSTAIGLWNNGRVTRVAHIDGGIVKQPDACRAAVEAAARGMVSGAVLASVVPRRNGLWKKLIRETLGCALYIVDATCPMAVQVDYPKPASIGADRLADVCGAVKRYGAPVIVADFGTALTFDVVTPDARYIGGVITPGLPLMRDYLYERTALLPRVHFTGSCPAIGRSTEQAMRIGAEVGYRGIVRETVAYLTETQGCAFKLVATGGYATWALRGSGMTFIVDDTLTLFGLGAIFEMRQ